MAVPDDLALLRTIAEGAEVSSERARAALSALAGGPHERAALEALLTATHGGRASPLLIEACAELLLRRGQAAAAAALLTDATSVAGLALRADALVSTGSLEDACAALELALARDVRAPGLRDRRDRLRARLGLTPLAPAIAAAQATLVTAGGPRLAYRIVAEAGRGGAATVYEAEDDALGRKLALKLYHRPREHAEQIGREARVAVAVSGPGIVRVFDASIDDGWIALEWAARGSLRDAIASGDMELAGSTRWVATVVRALARVHAAGWVHGDVKPANVLFRADGAAVLTDFGLAARVGEASRGGTPGYLSPARLDGAPASPADDVFALGRTLHDAYESLPSDRMSALAARLLAGDRPRDAASIELGDLG